MDYVELWSGLWECRLTFSWSDIECGLTLEYISIIVLYGAYVEILYFDWMT